MPEDKVTKEIAIPLPTPTGEPQRLLRVSGTEESGPTGASVGVLLPAKDGVPIPPGADLIQLQKCPDTTHFHVKTIYESPPVPGQQASGTARKPMQVSPATFASNWDRVFGKSPDETVN